MDLKKLVKEALDNRNCCQATKPKKSFILNESAAPREILSEGLKYHIDNNKPLTEHLYRAGSDKYFNLWAEARSFYSRNIIEVTNDDDLAILTETNLGEFGTLEDGTRVPLDFIMEDEYLDLNEFPFEYKGFKYNVEDTGGMVNDRGQKVWQVSIQDKNGDVDTTIVRGYSNKEGHLEAKDFIENELLPYYGLNEINLKSAGVRDAINKLKVHFKELGFPSLKAAIDFIKNGSIADWEEIRGELAALNEAKKGKKKDPPIGKPMRDTSGGKAYKVYVRDPKTKRIKTVRFGSGGLRAKINDPKARQAFAKRHKCSTRNDKTKASYWSCRLPRYAKLLGLKSSFSGFW